MESSESFANEQKINFDEFTAYIDGTSRLEHETITTLLDMIRDGNPNSEKAKEYITNNFGVLLNKFNVFFCEAIVSMYRNSSDFTVNLINNNFQNIIDIFNSSIFDDHTNKNTISNYIDCHADEFIQSLFSNNANFKKFCEGTDNKAFMCSMYFLIALEKYPEISRQAVDYAQEILNDRLEKIHSIESQFEISSLKEKIVSGNLSFDDKKKLDEYYLTPEEYSFYVGIITSFPTNGMFEDICALADAVPHSYIEDYCYLAFDIDNVPDISRLPDLLINHFEDFIIRSDTPFSTYKLLKDKLNSEKLGIPEETKSIVVSISDKLIEDCYSNNLAREIIGDDSVPEKCVEILSSILIALAKDEGVSIADTTFAGHGAYSGAYSIGNKVIKFGEKQKTMQIPNHRRILQPLIRSEIPMDNDDGQASKVKYIEVTQLCSNKPVPDKKELYELYKELREDGILWTDIKPDNVGRLMTDNKRYAKGIAETNDEQSRPLKSEWGSQMYAHSGQSIGRMKGNKEILHAGDLVIIDIDYMFVGEPNEPLEEILKDNYSDCDPYFVSDLCKEFEFKYCKEKGIGEYSKQSKGEANGEIDV